uniref:Ig-like domain-containing protein n=1 Tax=Gouania willdenowi TaxID=441366 RepID=A0A8C5DYP8_GOUWI
LHPQRNSMPTHVKGFPGSCVVIPCLFNYPDPESRATGFTGIWTDDSNHVIYHPVQSKMLQQYRGRTTLMGDIRQRNCSLKIDPLQESDHGPFHFRIEMDNYEKYSYIEQKVSIMPSPIQFTVTEEIEEGQNVSAFCSVAHSCPPSPPAFKWSHSGEENLQSQQLEHGLWNVTSTLTFQVTHADHRKPLKCTVEYKGGMHQEAYRSLQVKCNRVYPLIAHIHLANVGMMNEVASARHIMERVCSLGRRRGDIVVWSMFGRWIKDAQRGLSINLYLAQIIQLV